MIIVDPHKNISRLVTEEDLPTVLAEADKIMPLLNSIIGMYYNFYAIAHPQIEKDRPLRFFVLNTSIDIFNNFRSPVIINPVIIKHTKNEVDSEEGCASLSSLPEIIVKRYNAVTVEFTPLEFKGKGKTYFPIMGKRTTMNFRGKLAKIFQHEIDHLNGIYIIDK